MRKLRFVFLFCMVLLSAKESVEMKGKSDVYQKKRVRR